ncbi:HupE/UreJ family protein [Muricauda sp. CAU 1633]|uniref:HupE/UreJ family protein n=1 Tax=Allomuricauda sp. CAU 1633 TaxID=2816036 RepID=UPI001A8FC710|nr:HupE/UreJ family protein [Muricauda sp. CAU 1633]MBO0324138.1 HupE/UreJ family protein [Muricauda sp. CAU 1633]
MRRFFRHILLVFVLLSTRSVDAHEIRPAYLQIVQQSDNQYQLLWKVPTLGDMVLKIYPRFEDSFELTEAGLARPVSGAMIHNYMLTGNRPLEGSHIEIVNLNKTMVDVLVNITYLNGEKVSLMLQPDATGALLPGKTSKWQVVKTYTVLGIEHIWFGIDHLLFVLALIIITVGFKKIVKTITAFTLAHSITLSLAVLGYANLPGPPVEAVIALSIVFLASEMLKLQQGKPSLTAQKPWLVAFSFGLLHGFGFAGALADVGLPQSEIPLALAFFNVGVEVGQIVFVLAMLLILRLLALKKDWLPVLKKIPAYAIGSVAAFWAIERVIGFWS